MVVGDRDDPGAGVVGDARLRHVFQVRGVFFVGRPQQRQPQVGLVRQASSTDTAVELAPAETSRHTGEAGTSGLMRASTLP